MQAAIVFSCTFIVVQGSRIRASIDFIIVADVVAIAVDAISVAIQSRIEGKCI